MRPSITSGDERPPNGAVQTTFSFFAGSKLSGKPVSSEWPFWFGPRQWIQSAPCAADAVRPANRASANGSRSDREGSIGNSGLNSAFAVSLQMHDAAGLHLEPRQRAGRGGRDFDSEQ